MVFCVAVIFPMILTMVMGHLVSMLVFVMLGMDTFSGKEHCTLAFGVRSSALPIPREILRNI